MSKLLTTLLAATFVAATLTPMAYAADDMAKKNDDGVAAACKGKKPGDEVTVGGKKTKCPDPKAAKK